MLDWQLCQICYPLEIKYLIINKINNYKKKSQAIESATYPGSYCTVLKYEFTLDSKRN